MKYHFVTERDDYTPYASGLVLHSLGGHPPLPVRLSQEVFLRAYHRWQSASGRDQCTLYDPLCGSGATLAILKLLNWQRIGAIIGSDASPRALQVAELNFRLLTREGVQDRIDKLTADYQTFGKESHREALNAAQTFLDAIESPADSRHFLADATDPAQVSAGPQGQKVDIALLDIPYGDVAAWQAGANGISSDEAVQRVLASLAAVMHPKGIAAVFLPKSHHAHSEHFTRIQRINAGKREVWLLQPMP